MQRIVSGSTTERIVRTSIVTAMAVIGSAYCFYDGYVGYPRENLRRAVQSLSPPPETLPPIVQDLNSKTIGDLEGGTPLAQIKERWGEPGWRHQGEVRYFGPAGQLIIAVQNDDRVLKSGYQQATYKNELDLLVQKIMGVGIGIVALVLLVHWVRVVTNRTTLTDEGIKARGSPLVPFEAMTGLRAEQYARKGWVDVEYALNGRTGALRLDDYKVKAFPAIIEEICRRRGFENPHQKWLEAKSAKTSAGSSQPSE